jgi:hypothetical protein
MMEPETKALISHRQILTKETPPADIIALIAVPDQPEIDRGIFIS